LKQQAGDRRALTHESQNLTDFEEAGSGRLDVAVLLEPLALRRVNGRPVTFPDA
jgi:hypothetical protein